MTWTDEQIKFLIENFKEMSSFQLSKSLGISRTHVRMKYGELGLKKIELEYWNDEMICFLKQNYKTKGDVELAEIFQKQFPKKKKWTHKHIEKKRTYLNLHRSRNQVHKIMSANSKPGGPCYTIDKNSASKTLPDSYVLQKIAWRNKKLQSELLKTPQIIAIGRAQLLLNRKIKQLKNDNPGRSRHA